MPLPKMSPETRERAWKAYCIHIGLWKEVNGQITQVPWPHLFKQQLEWGFERFVADKIKKATEERNRNQ